MWKNYKIKCPVALIHTIKYVDCLRAVEFCWGILSAVLTRGALLVCALGRFGL